jgi:hypothetical protein
MPYFQDNKQKKFPNIFDTDIKTSESFGSDTVHAMPSTTSHSMPLWYSQRSYNSIDEFVSLNI